MDMTRRKKLNCHGGKVCLRRFRLGCVKDEVNLRCYSKVGCICVSLVKKIT